MNANVKNHLVNIFGSQINNERAINSAKTYPWWIALIMIIIGAFIPVIPIMVTQGNSKGSAVVNGSTYGFDQHVATLVNKIDNENKYLFYTENNKLLAKKDGVEYKDTWIDAENSDNIPDATPIDTYVETYYRNDTAYKRIALEVYYTDRVYSSKATEYTVYNMLKGLTKQTYVVDTNEPVKYTGQDEYKDSAKYTPSFVLLTKDGLFTYIYKTGTTNVGTYTSNGLDWANYKTENLMDDLATVKDVETNPLDANYVAGVLKNCKVLFDKCFTNQKIRNFWMMSGLFYGIHLVLVVFMGFMLWLLTRGKNNPNRGLKVYTCFWIAGWICIAPAILAMILGFIFTMAQQIAFIALIGLRTMWLAMRQLNPKY